MIRTADNTIDGGYFDPYLTARRVGRITETIDISGLEVTENPM